MLKNYLITAIRNILRSKGVSLINVLGLGAGFAATLLLIFFIRFELSYDRFHENADRIYRVATDIQMPDGTPRRAAMTLGQVGPAVYDEFPEVEQFLRTDSGNGGVRIKKGEKHFFEEGFIWADSSFFDVFSFPVLEGNPHTALVEPYSLVISKSVAEKYFGNEPACGQVLELNERTYTIKAVIEEMPGNSHFHAQLIGSVTSLNHFFPEYMTNRGVSIGTYLLIKEGVNMEAFEEKFNRVVNRIYIERFGSMKMEVRNYLQPITDIHLKSHLDFEMEANGSMSQIWVFAVLALFILLIAIVNFINLVTARSESRTKEIGVRKVLGARRKNLVVQFIGEAVILAFLAQLLGLFIVELSIGPFGTLVERPLVLTYDRVFWSIQLFTPLVLGVLSGLYPAFYLSAVKPVMALRGSRGSRSGQGGTLRKVLVVFQFAIAIFLLSCLSVLYMQVKYMKNKSLGFDQDQLLVVNNITRTIRDKSEVLKPDLMRIPGVRSVSFSMSVPGQTRNLQTCKIENRPDDENVLIHENYIDEDYLETYQIQLLQGRGFDKESGTDKASGLLINEEAVRALNLENPIGTHLEVWHKKGVVIGVINDYHFRSMHEKIEPLVVSMQRQGYYYITLKVNPVGAQEVIRLLNEKLSDADAKYIFSYYFMNDAFAQLYRAEERSNQLVTYSALLAIVIAVMGLFALTAFTIQQRITEIGIRKALGASVQNLVLLLSKDVLRWVLVAMLVAWPLAWWAMKMWLQNFAYQVKMAPWMFLVAGLAGVLIACLTVSGKAIRAASSNPVEALKYE